MLGDQALQQEGIFVVPLMLGHHFYDLIQMTTPFNITVHVYTQCTCDYVVFEQKCYTVRQDQYLGVVQLTLTDLHVGHVEGDQFGGDIIKHRVVNLYSRRYFSLLKIHHILGAHKLVECILKLKMESLQLQFLTFKMIKNSFYNYSNIQIHV